MQVHIILIEDGATNEDGDEKVTVFHNGTQLAELVTTWRDSRPVANRKFITPDVVPLRFRTATQAKAVMHLFWIKAMKQAAPWLKSA